MKAILNVNLPVLGWKYEKLSAGSMVNIIDQSKAVADKVLVERCAGGFRAWCYLDDLTPVEG